jgi:NAD(P)-dependent dehydrogenase (short-subunit alcohol dehydrogenase family)
MGAMHNDLATLFDLSGRTAIITGGSRGLGRAMALGFAKAGANVVVASRKLDACQQVVDDIIAAGGNALAVSVNLSDPTGLDDLVTSTVEAFGGVSIVVNNGGTVLDRPLDRLAQDTFTAAFTTNLLSPMMLVQAAREHLVASGHGAVLNITSIAASRATPTRYYYPAAKAALAQVTGSMARELGPLGIRVNAISPGTFRTDMVEKAYDDRQLAATAKATPVGRVAEPEELVGPALMLCSDAGSFVTGTVLTVDGGATT